MFSEIQNIHEDCNELFICLSEYAGKVSETIRLAGISELRTRYEIGRAVGQPHLLIFTRAGNGLLTTKNGQTVIEPQTLTVLPAGEGFLFELNSEEWQTCWFILEDCKQWQAVADIGQAVYHCREVDVVYSTLLLLHQQHELGTSQGSSRKRI